MAMALKMIKTSHQQNKRYPFTVEEFYIDQKNKNFPIFRAGSSDIGQHSKRENHKNQLQHFW